MTRKTTRTLLGLSIAMVMVLGSIPLGFSEPIYKQIEQEKAIEELECQNPSHVVVQRPNTNYACVLEQTAKKLGWTIQISTLVDDVFEMMNFDTPNTELPDIEYEFPYVVDSTKSNSNVLSEPRLLPLFATYEFSKFPVVGETAVLSINYTLHHFEKYEDFTTALTAHKNVEILSAENLDLNSMRQTTSEAGYWIVPKYVDEIKKDEPIKMSITFKVIEEGKVYFDFGDYDIISLHIGESKSMLFADYLKANPILTQDSEEKKCRTIECQLAGDQSHIEPEPGFNNGSPTQNSVVDDTNHFAGWTIQQKADLMRDNGTPESVIELFVELETLREQGYTQQELEDYLGEKLAKENANQDSGEATTQSTSFYVMNGKITNTPAPTDPDQIKKDSVNGLTVCAADWNSSTSKWTILNYVGGNRACQTVSENGNYFFSPVSTIDPNDEGLADVGLIMTASNTEANIIRPTTDESYSASSSIGDNVQPGNLFKNVDLTPYGK